MSSYFLPFLVILLVVAIWMGPSGSTVFILLYLLVGAYFLARLWSRRSMSALQAQRIVQPNAFLGEGVTARLEITNRSLLPILWLQLQESLPAALTIPGSINRVVSLRPGEKFSLDYHLHCTQRGYYSIGPLNMRSGDLLGFEPEQRLSLEDQHLTVFPKIIPLTRVHVPSHSPMGNLRSNQPIYEDPARVLGKRDYIAGDSLRSVDWKATAVANRLQVKIFEPSITIESAIFLNLNWNEYPMRNRYDVAELAITVAASLAYWLIRNRQAAGLYVNGSDPLESDKMPLALPIRGGQGQLMHILETLGRVQIAETFPLVNLIRLHSLHLSWGASILVISPEVEEAAFDQLFQARRIGLHPVMILCGQTAKTKKTREKALSIGIPVHIINKEGDLETWRH